MINKIIRNYLAKRMAGRSDDGIMITLKDPKKVIFAENILMDTLMRNGIDPRSITSEAQLKAILNQITKTRTIPADSPQGKGITEKGRIVLSKLAQVAFSSKLNQDILNGIMWPEVMILIDQAVAKAHSNGENLFNVDAAA